MWGGTYRGVGRVVDGRGEHPQNPRLPHGSAVKRHLQVPRAASSRCPGDRCQPGLVPGHWVCFLVWPGMSTSSLELLCASCCTPQHYARAFPGDAARC